MGNGRRGETEGEGGRRVVCGLEPGTEPPGHLQCDHVTREYRTEERVPKYLDLDVLF